MDNTSTNRGSGIQRVPRRTPDGADPLAALVQDVAGTREVRRILSTVIPEALNIWAENSISRRTISRPAGSLIRKGFTRPGDILEAPEIPLLFENPEFLKRLGDNLPDIISILLDSAAAGARGLSNLPAEDRNAFMSGLVKGMDPGKPSAVVNAFVRLINDMHATRPDFLAAALEPAITGLIAQTDFGDLKDLMDTSAEDIAALAGIITGGLLAHPAKMVLLLSFLPTTANLVTGILKDALNGANTLAPDLLTDVMLSFVRELNGESIGQVINELTELARKLHTGSALIGEPGAPRFSNEAGRLVNAAAAVIDPELLFKALRNLADGRDTIEAVLNKAMAKKPDLLVNHVRHSREVSNRRIRSLNRHLALLKEGPEKEITGALIASATDADAGELAEIVNQGLRIVKRILENRPNLIAAQISRFMDSLDLALIEEILPRIMDDTSDAMAPLAREALPVLITQVFRWLSNEYDGDESSVVNDARQAVREFLQIEEETL